MFNVLNVRWFDRIYMGGWEAPLVHASVPAWEPNPARKNRADPQSPADENSSRRRATGEGEEPGKPGTLGVGRHVGSGS